MEIWLASDNQGKLAEMKLLLASAASDLGAPQWHLQREIPGFTPRPETGKTFAENARTKAKTLAAVRPGTWVLGEDSGLCVTGLGDLPGIHSARYAGDRATDLENTTKLLKMMTLRQVADRSARFVCSLTVITPKGEEWSFNGEWQGQISSLPKGQHGFGYDPVFIPAGASQTVAELGPAIKTSQSHRTKALQQWLAKVRANL